MKTMASILTAAFVAAAAPAMAQHSGHGTAPAAAPAAAELADGEVRRVDATKGTVLLKHGEIKNLNMGGMTMSFKLKDPAFAAGLKPGDKVKFAAEQQGDDLIVTQIHKVN
jgi:Cu/Ag efflux protein CusF